MDHQLKRTRKMSETEAPPAKKVKYDFQAAAERRREFLCKKHSKSVFIQNAKQFGLDEWCERVGIPRKENFVTFSKTESMIGCIEFLFEQWYSVTSEAVKDHEWTTTEFLYFAEISHDGSNLETDMVCEEHMTVFLYLKNKIYAILRRSNCFCENE